MFRLPIAVPPLACKDMLTVRRRSAQARKNAMAPTARSAPLEKIERLAETRERQIPCSVWASAWAPKTKKMRLLEIRRAHPLSHRVSLVHTFAYQNVLFQITPDRSCCRARTPRAQPEDGAGPAPDGRRRDDGRRHTGKYRYFALSIYNARRNAAAPNLSNVVSRGGGASGST